MPVITLILQKEWDNWQQFLTGVSLPAYLTFLKSDGTYADQLTIEMACQYLQVGIRIIQRDGQVCLFVCWSLTSLCHSNGHIEKRDGQEIVHGDAASDSELLLGYLADVLHYFSVQRFEHTDSKPGILMSFKTFNNSSLDFVHVYTWCSM